ncbi:hypothetical protein Tco_1344884 [Tanacetum coccineum]
MGIKAVGIKFEATRKTLRTIKDRIKGTVVNFEPDPRVPIILGRPSFAPQKLSLICTKETIDYKSGSTTTHSDDPSPSSSSVKTSDNLEEFADELILLKKDIQEGNFQVHSNSLFEFDDNFKSSTINPRFDEMEEDIEIENSNVSDEPVLLNTPLSDKVECFAPEDDNDEIDAFLAMEVSSKFKEVISDHEPEQNESSITFSPKSDPLHHEFAGEAITLPERNDREFEEYLSLMTVRCEISTSQSQGNVHANQSLVIESLPISPIPVEDSEPTQEEIDIFLVPDDLIPPGAENDDSEDKVNELPNLDHQDDSSIPCPPPKPPDIKKCFEPEADLTMPNSQTIPHDSKKPKRATNDLPRTSRHSQPRRNWLSANEIELIKLVKSGPKAPATPYVHKSLPPSQVLASRQKFKAVFHQFEEKISALLLTFDIVEAPSSNCLGEDLRSACLDGLKVENVSLKRRYDELSKANTHSRTAYTENTKLKAQVTGTTSSGPSTSETPKVLAPGMYNVGSKYIPPPKRANWDKPTPLPKKKQDKTPLLELAKLWPKRALGINSSLRLRVRIQERHSRDLWHSNCSIVSDSGCSNIMTDMVDLLKGSRTTNLYSISLNDMMSASPVCLLTKASSTKSVDDFTRFGWVRFLRTKDETPQVIEKFIVKTQRALNATVRFVEQIMRNGLSEKTETELYGKLLVLCSSCESSHCFPMADAVATGFGEYGNVLKNKARIVGERITTEACIDFAESFAPVNQKEFVDPEHAIACVPPQDSSLWALNQSPRAGYDKLSAFSNQVRITKGKVDPTPITREAANISYWDKYMVSKTQKESTNSVSAQFLWTSACSWSKPKSRKVNGPSPQQT